MPKIGITIHSKNCLACGVPFTSQRKSKVCCSAKCAGTFAWKNHTKLERPPEFYAWKTMIARCKNPNRHDWDRYGGRGITVCERWLKYENFAQDMGPRPSADHSIERRENNGNYEPSNC